jgi:hypothetical protein
MLLIELFQKIKISTFSFFLKNQDVSVEPHLTKITLKGANKLHDLKKFLHDLSRGC